MEKTYATLTNVVEEYSAQVEITLHQASLYTLTHYHSGKIDAKILSLSK